MLRWLEFALWSVGIVFLGCYAWVYLDRTAYQAYEGWAFERSLAHKPAPAIGFVLHSLPFHDEGRTSAEAPDAFQGMRLPEGPRPRRHIRLQAGDLIGRIEIPRIGLHAMVVESTTERALRRAVGHIEGTPLPGEPGNAGFAAHRDTFFRGLRDIQKGDRIDVTTRGGAYHYVVDSILIVGPNDVEVLGAAAAPTLTLVTCFPFDYIGAAPRRFVVEAREVGGVIPQPLRGS